MISFEFNWPKKIFFSFWFFFKWDINQLLLFLSNNFAKLYSKCIKYLNYILKLLNCSKLNFPSTISKHFYYWLCFNVHHCTFFRCIDLEKKGHVRQVGLWNMADVIRKYFNTNNRFSTHLKWIEPKEESKNLILVKKVMLRRRIYKYLYIRKSA